MRHVSLEIRSTSPLDLRGYSIPSKSNVSSQTIKRTRMPEPDMRDSVGLLFLRLPLVCRSHIDFLRLDSFAFWNDDFKHAMVGFR